MCKDDIGPPSLHLASCYGYFDVVHYLITDCKCDPMCTTNDGNTPLNLVSYSGHLDVVRYLITECKCGPKCKNKIDQTSLRLSMLEVSSSCYPVSSFICKS